MQDLVDRAVLKPRSRTQEHQRAGVNTAGKHMDILFHLKRLAVAGEHSVIHSPLSAQHDAVDRDTLARAHEYKIADTDLFWGYLMLLPLHVDKRSLVRDGNGLPGHRLMCGTEHQITGNLTRTVQDQHQAGLRVVAQQERAERGDQDE